RNDWEWPHAAQADRRESHDRRRAPGPLPRRARGRCAGDPHPSPGRPSQPRPELAGRRHPTHRVASAVCRLARSAAGQPTRQRAGRGPPGYLRTRSLRTRERGAPTRLRTRLTFQRRTPKTSQRVAPSGSQSPGLSTGATPPARGSPPGAHRYPPRYTPPAARRARRYARVPPMDSGDEPLPMMTTSTLGLDYFWTPIMAYFSAPIDSWVFRGWSPSTVRTAVADGRRAALAREPEVARRGRHGGRRRISANPAR